MGKSILAAIVAAIIASIATTLVMSSVMDDQVQTAETRMNEAEKRAEDAEARVETALDRLDRFSDRVQRAEKTANDAQRNAIAAVQAAGATPADESGALVAPDGTAYLSRAEFARLLEERGPVGQPLTYEPPPPPMTLAEAAEELGLTAAQEASLAVLYRDAEQDFVNMLFGNRSIEDVKAEIERTKDDPDAQAAMVQGALMRGFSNIGKFMTYEKRMRKKIEDILGTEKAQEYRQLNVKAFDEGVEDILEELFDGM